MEPDGVDTPLTPSRVVFGWEIYESDGCMAWAMRNRWRILWHNPRYRENWRIDWVFDEGVWQIGIGPAVLVYIRGDDY